MITPSKPSPGEGGRGVQRWKYEPIANGKGTVGFLAGPPCGCWTHYIGGTKPCRKKMTRGKLSCPFCVDKWEPVWRGAVPWYDREYVRRFVWITEDYYESVCEIDTHAMIELKRDKDTHAPVIIRADPWRTTPLPLTRDRREPVLMMPFLVRVLWKDEELAHFAEQAEMGAEEIKSPGAEIVAAAKNPLARLIAAEEREKQRQKEEERKIANTMDAVLHRSVNGDGGPKKPR